MPDKALVAAKVAQTIATKIKLLDRLTNWFVRWMVPLRDEHVIIRIEEVPNVQIHYDSDSYELIWVFNVINHTPYDIDFYGYDCDVSTSSSPLFQVENNRRFILKPIEKERLVLRRQLDRAEIRKAESRSQASGDTTLYARYKFTFTVNTRFGPLALRPEAVHGAMIINRYGQQKA
jgi:hypothetical protein